MAEVDPTTVSFYDRKASELADRYETADMSHMHHLLLRHLPDKGSTVLEVGCGTGRDAAFLTESGFQVTGVDASAAMIDQALRLHPELSERLSCAAAPLPDDSPILDERFDAVVSIATFMHIPEQDLFAAAFQLRGLLRPGGVLFLSTSLERPGLQENRDGDGRLFLERPPEELRLLFERLGFRLVGRYITPDGFARDVRWCSLVFTLEGEPGSRSVDQIETIISRDRKTATYKLALLRALCEIAQSEPFKARWTSGDQVAVPLGLVAEKWLLYYWPLVEPDLAAGRVAYPQLRGLERRHPMAFRQPLRRLIASYPGGLAAFYQDYKSERIPEAARPLALDAFKTIARTLVVGPIKYAGGALGQAEPLFGFRKAAARLTRLTPADVEQSMGDVLVSEGVWREMALIGHWVGESIVLRWAELAGEMSRGAVSPARVVERLLIRPVVERDVGLTRAVYSHLTDLECVWTGEPLGRRRLQVDHVIPFSLWFNNDLWNLLPTSGEVNREKSDRLVARPTLLRSRDRIIHYWEILRGESERRFTAEVGRALLRQGSPKGGWQQAAFSGLLENVETVALQRGVARWSA